MPDRDYPAAILAVFALACSRPLSEAEPGAGDAAVAEAGLDVRRCAVVSDAGIASPFGPVCYPESSKPSGRCAEATASCSFCSYPPCPEVTSIVEPRSHYDCACVAGAWSCATTFQSDSGCARVLSCLWPDGAAATTCLSTGDTACVMSDGAPTCVLGLSGVSCGDSKCARGCTCSDPLAPSCTCQ